MKKLLLIFTLFCLSKSNAQSKVFREVANQIYSTTKPIIQNRNVIGYIVFTQLEKVNSDSFNYTINIMYENLNDIGKVDFKEKELKLKDLTFENDLLHIAYSQTAFVDSSYNTDKKGKKYFNGKIEYSTNFLIQTVNLEGKIINVITRKLSPIKLTTTTWGSYSNSNVNNKYYNLQLNENGNNGFTCFYNDQDSACISLFNSKSELIWNKKIEKDASNYFNINTKNNTYVVYKHKINNMETTSIVGYNLASGEEKIKRDFIDEKYKIPLHILSIQPDKKTGNLTILGKIYKEYGSEWAHTFMENRKGLVAGVFTTQFNDNNEKDIKNTVSYWSDESKLPELSIKGEVNKDGVYPFIVSASTDYSGNSLFVGYGAKIRSRLGAIILTINPWGFWYGVCGGSYRKMKFTDGYVYQQNSKGDYKQFSKIDLSKDGYQGVRKHLIASEPKSYRNLFFASNSSDKSDFIIYDDNKNYTIFNATNNKVSKKITQTRKKINIQVVPAKEGHIMIIEKNNKEKTTTLSIEAI